MIFEYLKENLEDKIEDLKVGTTVYRVDDIDKEEFVYMNKVMEKSREKLKNFDTRINDLKNGWITKDTKSEIKALESEKKSLENWDNKVKPWMLKVLKHKGLI